MAVRVANLPRRSIGTLRQTIVGATVGAGAVLAVTFFHLQTKQVAVRTPEPIVAAYDMIEVPVPVEPVLAGTRATDITFRKISYPRHQVPMGAVLDPMELRDAVSATALPANMPLFGENFSRKIPGMNPVIERIPPGMRAMTIRVDATSAVEGWAGSGSIVDVLLITHDKTSVIAEQVKVLSAERVVAPVEGAGSPQVPSTATLLVNQEQCLAINTAIPLGKIAFALRSPDDRDGWMSAQYTADRLRGRGAAVETNPDGITGFLSIPSRNGGRSFALSGGKWVETEVIPEGFRVNGRSAG